MRVFIQLKGTELPAAAAEILDRKVRFELARIASRIRSVHLRIIDDNGPRGGVDHRCSIEARLIPGGHVRAEALDVEPTASGVAAIRRLARGVHRELDRRRFANRTRVRRLARRQRILDCA